MKSSSNPHIRMLALDVDGTMTDGKIYIGNTGELMKAFHVKDGQGIAMLRQSGILTAIITARRSEIVERRAEELKFDEVLQGVSDKASALKDLCEKYAFLPEEVAYMGDDLGDLPAMLFSGVSFCPSDAVPAVRNQADVVTLAAGGNGAVREAAELILKWISAEIS